MDLADVIEKYDELATAQSISHKHTLSNETGNLLSKALAEKGKSVKLDEVLSLIENCQVLERAVTDVFGSVPEFRGTFIKDEDKTLKLVTELSK